LENVKASHNFPSTPLNNIKFKSVLSAEKHINYLRNSVHRCYVVPTSIKYISKEIGYGLFTKRKLNKNQFIGEYTGEVVRDGNDNEYAWE
jgi:SET domain-containing protein